MNAGALISGGFQKRRGFSRGEASQGIDCRAQLTPVVASNVMQVGQLPNGIGQGQTVHRSSVLNFSAPRANARGNGLTNLRVCVILVLDHPSLGPPSAVHAPQEHRATVAAHAVVMTRHVAEDPTPHSAVPWGTIAPFAIAVPARLDYRAAHNE